MSFMLHYPARNPARISPASVTPQPHHVTHLCHTRRRGCLSTVDRPRPPATPSSHTVHSGQDLFGVRPRMSIVGSSQNLPQIVREGPSIQKPLGTGLEKGVVSRSTSPAASST